MACLCTIGKKEGKLIMQVGETVAGKRSLVSEGRQISAQAKWLALQLDHELIQNRKAGRELGAQTETEDKYAVGSL